MDKSVYEEYNIAVGKWNRKDFCKYQGSKISIRWCEDIQTKKFYCNYYSMGCMYANCDQWVYQGEKFQTEQRILENYFNPKMKSSKKQKSLEEFMS